MPMNPDILVNLNNISFHYNGDPTITDINLEVTRGEFLGVIGPNGSGKTTLLKIILGLIKPQTGSVQLFGQDIDTFTDWSKIGYVPQKAGSMITQFPITVEEIVSLGRMNNKRWLDVTSRKDRHAINEAISAVGMETHRKELLRTLSGGQEQRVFIARALASNPELLILDEPTVGVDIEAQEKFYQMLRSLHQQQKLTLMLVSHDIDVVAHEVNTIVCINRTLLCHGKPKEVLKSDFLETAYGKELRFVIHGH